jgi:hypothetical protein
LDSKQKEVNCPICPEEIDEKEYFNFLYKT